MHEEDRWVAPKPIEREIEQLIKALPTNMILYNTDTATGRLKTVLAHRKKTVQDQLDRLHSLFGASDRDSLWADSVSRVAAVLSGEASAVADIYDVGAGIGAPQVRAQRRRASDEWRNEALTWERFSDRARDTAEEKRKR